MNIDFNDLNLDNIGNWPPMFKSLVIGVICLVLLIVAYKFDTQAQIDALNAAQDEEYTLREQFETKQQQTANLVAYRQQLIEIEASLGKLISQLPAKTEVPALLEDISKTGKATGLHFRLFQPQPEQQREFIAELPIKMSVVGNYHQLARFISRIVALSRIVTLHDFTIAAPDEIQVKGKESNTTKKIKDEGSLLSAMNLKMDITAKTYRYKE